MTKKNVKPAPSKYFHEVMKEEQELLKLSYEESVRQREERKNRERKKNDKSIQHKKSRLVKTTNVFW